MMEYNKELNNSGYSKDLLLYPTHLRDACRVRCAMLDGLWPWLCKREVHQLNDKREYKESISICTT